MLTNLKQKPITPALQIVMVRRKLKPTIDPPTPEKDLMFAVFEQALSDSLTTVGDPPNPLDYTNTTGYRTALCAYLRRSAIKESGLRYLEGDMLHLQIIGINSGYARRVIQKIADFIAVNPTVPTA